MDRRRDNQLQPMERSIYGELGSGQDRRRDSPKYRGGETPVYCQHDQEREDDLQAAHPSALASDRPTSSFARPETPSPTVAEHAGRMGLHGGHPISTTNPWQ